MIAGVAAAWRFAPTARVLWASSHPILQRHGDRVMIVRTELSLGSVSAHAGRHPAYDLFIALLEPCPGQRWQCTRRPARGGERRRPEGDAGQREAQGGIDELPQPLPCCNNIAATNPRAAPLRTSSRSQPAGDAQRQQGRPGDARQDSPTAVSVARRI